MYDEVTFKAELGRLLPPEYNTIAHKECCWNVYNNASNPNNRRLVAGNIDDLNLAITILGKTDGSKNGKGSVLHKLRKEGSTIDKGWSIILNDAWILGGIHGHVNFELVSVPTEQSIINSAYTSGDSVERKFRVTGRELIGLTTFGYAQVYGPVEKVSMDIRPIALSGVNMLFHCVDPALADSATFTRYGNEMRRSAKNTIDKGWGGLNGMI